MLLPPLLSSSFFKSILPPPAPHYLCIMAYCHSNVHKFKFSPSLAVCVCVCYYCQWYSHKRCNQKPLLNGKLVTNKIAIIFNLPLQCIYHSCKLNKNQLFRKIIINYVGLTLLCVSHDMWQLFTTCARFGSPHAVRSHYPSWLSEVRTPLPVSRSKHCGPPHGGRASGSHSHLNFITSVRRHAAEGMWCRRLPLHGDEVEKNMLNPRT